MSALERRRGLRKQNQKSQRIKAQELKVIQQQGFRSIAHKKRYEDRVARNPELKEPRISWNDAKDVMSNKSAEQIHKERARNSEILELDYLHQLNEAWLADKERLYVEKREQVVFRHQEMTGLMHEDFRSRFYTLQVECVSKQELRIENKMLTERKEQDFEDSEEAHIKMLHEFDSDFEVELRRFTQVIRRRTDDWIAHCRLYDMYVKKCRAFGTPVCTRFSTELGHQHISLRSYGLGHVGTKVIADIIAQNCFLHSIDLSNNAIGDEGAAALALAIRGGKGNGMLRGDERDETGKVQMLCALRDLRVAKNNISSSGASDLLAACCIGKDRPRTPARAGAASGPGNSRMAAKTVIEILDISSNIIADDISNTLETVLSSHLCGLRKLDMSYNKLGIKSARAVGVGLSVNRTLRQLSLRWNSLGAGADDIATACVSNDCLETLDLGFCACGDVCALRFANAVAENPEHSEEERRNLLSRENTESKALESVLQGRRWLSTMEQLLLDHNNISSQGAKPLLVALLTNVTLRVLDIAGNENDIGFGCKEIIKVLKNGGSMPNYDDKGNIIEMKEETKEDTLDEQEQQKEQEEQNQTSKKSSKTPPKLPDILPCRVGVDVPGSTDNDYALENLTQDALKITRYLIAPGGVDRAHLRHETHETAMTFIIQPNDLILLQKYITDARTKHKKDVLKAKAAQANSNELLDSDEEEFDHWLHSDHSNREIPIHAFKPEQHVSVMAHFTRGISRNAMDAAESFGHETPKNVVRLEWPLPVLPPAVLRRAEMRTERHKESGQPLEFRCVISRVSTSKGDGTRFSVTNSIETEFLLPSLEENTIPEPEIDDKEETGWGSVAKDVTPEKAKKRMNWVDRLEEKKDGGDAKNNESTSDTNSDTNSDNSDNSDQDQELSDEDQWKEREPKQILIESDRVEEFPSILLTWEPLEKFGRAVVQFYLPTYFVAGLELDLGSTIMLRHNTEFGADELKKSINTRNRKNSMGTMRMKNSESASRR